MATSKDIPGSPARKSECIFCKIAEGGLPAYKVYEDSDTLAFLDIFPVSHGHTLIIPKKHCTDIFDAPEQDMQKLIATARKVAPAVMKATKADGINLGMNNRSASGQVVMHAHLHIIPRFKDDGLKSWPQRPYQSDKEKERAAQAIKEAF